MKFQKLNRRSHPRLFIAQIAKVCFLTNLVRLHVWYVLPFHASITNQLVIIGWMRKSVARIVRRSFVSASMRGPALCVVQPVIPYSKSHRVLSKWKSLALRVNGNFAFAHAQVADAWIVPHVRNRSTSLSKSIVVHIAVPQRVR